MDLYPLVTLKARWQAADSALYDVQQLAADLYRYSAGTSAPFKAVHEQVVALRQELRRFPADLLEAVARQEEERRQDIAKGWYKPQPAEKEPGNVRA